MGPRLPLRNCPRIWPRPAGLMAALEPRIHGFDEYKNMSLQKPRKNSRPLPLLKGLGACLPKNGASPLHPSNLRPQRPDAEGTGQRPFRGNRCSERRTREPQWHSRKALPSQTKPGKSGKGKHATKKIMSDQKKTWQWNLLIYIISRCVDWCHAAKNRNAECAECDFLYCFCAVGVQRGGWYAAADLLVVCSLCSLFGMLYNWGRGIMRNLCDDSGCLLELLPCTSSGEHSRLWPQKSWCSFVWGVE